MTPPIPELVEFLRRHTAPTQLMHAHRDDGTGHCTTCSAGAQTGRLVWPCHIWQAAHHAARPPAATPTAALGPAPENVQHNPMNPISPITTPSDLSGPGAPHPPPADQHSRRPA